MSRRRDVDLGLSMQLSLPRRFDSTLSPSMIVPRCGSTLQLIVADLCGRRRYHTFSAIVERSSSMCRFVCTAFIPYAIARHSATTHQPRPHNTTHGI